MGKKFSHKISEDEKKNKNSYIKVLKPKVYIIDNSNFKRLVQELTGNENSNSTCSPPPMETQLVINEEVVPVLDLEDHRESVYINTNTTTSSREDSVDASSDELLCSQVFWNHNEDFLQVCNQISSLDDTNLQDRIFGAQDMDLLACGDYLESWLLDSNQFNPNFNKGYGHVEQEDVSIYDYEPSWLL